MPAQFGNIKIGAMQYGGVTIGEAMMDGQIVYRSAIRVAPQAPTFLAASPWVTLPTQEGVTYSVSGTPGYDQAVTVTATAQEGYELVGTASWSHTYGPPPRFAEEYSSSASFDAIEAQWQIVLFIAIDQHVRTSGVWQVVWDSQWDGRLYGVRVSVSGTPVATTGPEEVERGTGVTQSVTLPDFDVLPGQRIEFECYATSTNNIHRRVRSHYLKLQ